MTNLSVELRARADRLERDLKKVNDALRKTEKTADKTQNALTDIGKKGGQSFSKVKKGTANATPAVLEFNRAIQDAPFGIQGVANNIQQLTANFGSLSQKLGGSKAAVKAMVAQLAGPQGILLAVSVVTAIMVAWQNGMFKTRTAAEKLNDTIKKNNEALQKYIEGLRAVASAQLKSQKSSAKEIIVLGQLRRQIEDTGNSLEIRKDGIIKLRKEFPAYFKGIKDEKLLNGQAATSYNILTNSILKRAKATAGTQLLVANAKKEFEISTKLASINDQIAKDRIKLIEREKEAVQLAIKGVAGAETAAAKARSSRNAINDGIEETIRLQKLLDVISKENLELEASVKANIVVEPTIDKGSASKLRKYLSDSLPIPDRDELNKAFGIDVESQERLEKKSRLLAFKIGNALNPAPFIKVGELRGRLTEMELALIDFNENVNDLIQFGLSDTFSNIGAEIGNALATGGNAISAAGNALIGTFGNFLQKMGSLLIEYGTLALLKGKLDIAIAAGGPLAIGAGIAAIAAGIAITAVGAAFSSAANSGLSGSVGGQGSSSASVGPTNYGVAASGGGGTVVFEIAGNKLVGVLNRTLSQNKNLGGNLTIGNG